MADEDQLYPINLLTEELKSDETEVRIRSMQRLKTVAQALGPERTRTELIPFLNDSTEDEDEILVTLANELGEGFVSLVGGPIYAPTLFDPLEALANVEETVVRQKAVESIQKIIATMDDATETIVPMIKRLAEGDWFTSRVSACSLFGCSYKKVSNANAKKELRELFATLCRDDTPMVRRAATNNLGNFFSVVEKEHLLNIFLDLFKTLANDDQDSVRLLAIGSSAAISKLLTEEENKTHILALIKASVEDRSWRVRFGVAKEFSPLSSAMGKGVAESDLLECFVNLLQDAETEVRAAAAKNIAGYYDLVDTDHFISDVLPILSTLAQDSAPNVRVSVAVACMELSPKIGEEITKEELVPLFLLFLRDEIVDVRLSVLKRMNDLSHWMNSFESTILPAITELATDMQWRVREAVIAVLPAFAESLGMQYFEANLLELLLAGFTDMVGQVRNGSSSVLPALLEAVGSSFVIEILLPKLTDIYANSMIYQERVNILHALKNLTSEKCSPDLLAKISQLTVQFSKDKIPNVRLAACLTLKELCMCANESLITSEIKPCLQQLEADLDLDVKHFAAEAIASISK